MADWRDRSRCAGQLFLMEAPAAVALDIDSRSAIYDGPDTYEEDIDAAMKARIEEDRWSQ